MGIPLQDKIHSQRAQPSLQVLSRFLVILLILPALPTEAAPIAKQGVLDLSDWDFSRDGNVSLRGDYEFYWKQLLDHQDIMAETPDTFILFQTPGRELT